MKSKFSKIIFYIIICALPLITINCSNSDDGTTYSYNGPGSEYSITLDDGDDSFVVTESESGMVVNGTYSTLSSGFTLLTVTSATGDDAPSAGDQAYGIDVPGYVFLLKPMSEDSDIIPMVAAGDCPTDDFTANWIVTSIDDDANFENSCPASDGLDGLGTFSYDYSESTASLPNKYDICGTDLGDYSLDTFSCSAGKATIESDNAELYLTSSGGMLVKIDPDSETDDDHQIIVALPSDEISDSNDFDGNYIGLILTNDSGASVYPVTGSFDTDTFSFDEVDPDSGSITSDNGVNGDVTFTATNSPSNGFMSGTFSLDSGGGPYKVKCMASYDIFDSGKNFIFCIGRSPGGGDEMFNALLISK